MELLLLLLLVTCCCLLPPFFPSVVELFWSCFEHCCHGSCFAMGHIVYCCLCLILFQMLRQNIKCRDLYDGSPLLLKGWTKGQVTICGDAAHPVMPNLGQGGCQVTEDGFCLAEELANVQHTYEIEEALNSYFLKRIGRTKIIRILAQLGSNFISMNCSICRPNTCFYIFFLW